MKAIERIRRTHLSTREIAAHLGCTTHAIRNYERGLRFPSEEQYARIVRLAAERGIVLTATDFVASNDNNNDQFHSSTS